MFALFCSNSSRKKVFPFHIKALSNAYLQFIFPIHMLFLLSILSLNVFLYTIFVGNFNTSFLKLSGSGLNLNPLWGILFDTCVSADLMWGESCLPYKVVVKMKDVVEKYLAYRRYPLDKWSLALKVFRDRAGVVAHW